MVKKHISDCLGGYIKPSSRRPGNLLVKALLFYLQQNLFPSDQGAESCVSCSSLSDLIFYTLFSVVLLIKAYSA